MDQQRKVSMVDWTSQIYGILWGVWWAFFIEKWLQSSQTYIYILGKVISRDMLLFISALVLGVFVVAFVRWLWTVAQWGRRTTVPRFTENFWPMFVLALALLIAVNAVGESFQLGTTGAVYGFALTIVWILVPVAQTIYL